MRRTRYNRNSAFASQQSGPTKDYFEDMRNWCQGRWWLPRLAMLIWFAYIWVGMMRDPNYRIIFDPINLGIHELGHYLWSPFGEFMMFLGGSLTEVLAPLVSVLIFYRQRDYFGMAFCFGWLSTSCYSLASYIGDARAQLLPLVTPGEGEPIHDWHYMLGRLGILKMDSAFALITRGIGAASMLVLLIGGGYQVWLMFRSPRRFPSTASEDALEEDVMRSSRD